MLPSPSALFFAISSLPQSFAGLSFILVLKVVRRLVCQQFLLDALRQRYFGRENDLADAVLNSPLLLMDDLGMEPLMENITVEQIYHLINSRLSRGLYTAISTNLSRTELQKRYTERVTSRLLDVRTGMAIPFRGEDIRLKK